MKRIGVISDPHGNLLALEAVLAELEREELDGLVCLGDVAVGPQPPRRSPASVALGCPSSRATGTSGSARASRRADDEIGRKLVEIGEFWAAQLSAEDLAAMRGFAPTVDLDLGDGVTALCFHGSPSSNVEGIYSETPDETLAQILGDARDAGPALRPHAPPDAAPPRALAGREPGLDRAAVQRLGAAHDQDRALGGVRDPHARRGPAPRRPATDDLRRRRACSSLSLESGMPHAPSGGSTAGSAAIR